MTHKQPNKIFISCGQQTDEEKELGKKIQKLVRELTQYDPYFAEFQNSLEGLSKNIFSELYKCKGFITVLHRRGEVSPGDHSRASVWVEQEIAIAAFIKQVLKKDIKIVPLIQSGIKLEGVRKQLILNPKEFTSNNDALEFIRTILSNWDDRPNNADPLTLTYRVKDKHLTHERHDYDFVINVKNNSDRKINDYHVDIEFPRKVLVDKKFKHEIAGRKTDTHIFLRAPTKDEEKTIYPGDPEPLLRFGFYVDGEIFRDKVIMGSHVTATLYSEDQLLSKVEIPFNKIQKF